MRKILFLLLITSFVSAEELFTLKSNEVKVIGEEEINITEVIENVNDDVRIITLDDQEGEIKLIGINDNGDTDIKTVSYSRVDENEWNDYVMSISRFATLKSSLNNKMLEENGPADLEAIELAQNFIGMAGSCNKVAQAFISKYLGQEYSIYNTVKVTKEEAIPGDVIFYEDGGLGLQHWAVYLGGNSALQGNINGTTVIGSVYMNYGSEPQFLRPVLN